MDLIVIGLTMLGVSLGLAIYCYSAGVKATEKRWHDAVAKKENARNNFTLAAGTGVWVRGYVEKVEGGRTDSCWVRLHEPGIIVHVSRKHMMGL